MTEAKKIPISRGVLTDVDCTLLDSQRQLSIENRDAIIDYLIESQRNSSLPKLALCTARHPAALIKTVLPIFAKFAPESLHVVCDGAMIINAKAEVLWQEVINPLITKKICQDVEKLNGSFAFGNGRVFYCGKSFLEGRRQSSEPIDYLPYTDIKDDNNWTTGLIVINHLNESVEAYIQGLEEKNKFHLDKSLSTFDQQPYYNLTLPGVSKVKGLKKWAEYYDLDAKEIMMVGDGDNDISAMKKSIGVAVANAKPEVKEVAKLILEHSNDEGAIAWLLQGILKESVA
jgi:Cof subfamily protein (haloacid dehalogenase superfamily)